ncbi:MAG: 6-carboxytetrahydropterin synthase [Planctomycetota bacterium]
MPHYELLLESEFSAAHRLRMHDGTLEPLHGHNWRVEVFIEGGDLDSAGLLADFVVLQRNLAIVVGRLHDTCLNELPAFAERNPSTELVAKHLHDAFVPMLPTGVRMAKVRVWETRTCAAAYVPGE